MARAGLTDVLVLMQVIGCWCAQPGLSLVSRGFLVISCTLCCHVKAREDRRFEMLRSKVDFQAAELRKYRVPTLLEEYRC